jgi:hypothetical protein
VRRAFLLDHPPPLRTSPLRPVVPRPIVVSVEPVRIEPEQVEHMASIVQQLHAALVSFATVLCDVVRGIVETFRRAFPAGLSLVEFEDAARYVRRMDAHWHRTAGRPRSRMRPGRRRRR